MSFFVSGASKGGEGGEAPVQAPEPEAPPVPMWQLHNRYILAETRQGLVIVDQHAAHERVLYEELMRDFAEEGRTGQHLLFPITLRLSPAEFTVVEDLAGILSRAGFEIEPFGGNSVLIRAVPDPHPHFDAERCIREMITELTQGSELVNAARNQHERVGLSYACKAAIKSGQKLSREEMAELFDRLFATELPYHDVHGRSTVVQLSLRELDQRFGRS
jgi:DNA mismatch repair protein MutL